MTVANGGTLGQAFTGFAVAAVASGLPGSSELGGMAGALGDAIGSDIGAMLMTSGMIAKAQGGKFIDGVKGFAVGAAAGALGNTLGKAYRSSPATKRLVEVADSKASADSQVTAYPVEGPAELSVVSLHPVPDSATLTVSTLELERGFDWEELFFGPDEIGGVPILKGELPGSGKGLRGARAFFKGKTKSQISKMFEKKFGPAKSTRQFEKTYYNPRSKRSFNVHHEPGHQGGRPHVDIRRRGGFDERKYFLKD